METRRLLYFLKIADTGSVSRAAAHFGLAQPALSQQLAVLEGELKARLFDRSPSGVTLTPAGRALYFRAQLILRQIEGLNQELHAPDSAISGPASVGLAPSLDCAFGPALVERVLSQYPGLRLQLIENSSRRLLEELQNGLLDIVIAPIMPASDRFAVKPLFKVDMLLVTAASAPPPPADIAALAREPWIITRSPNAIRNLVGALFAEAGLEPRIVAEVESLPVVIRSVAKGLGLTMAPKIAVMEEIANGEVKAWPLPGRTMSRTVNLCRRAEPETEQIAAAIEGLLRGLAADCGMEAA